MHDTLTLLAGWIVIAAALGAIWARIGFARKNNHPRR